jgi:hypothetical protein
VLAVDLHAHTRFFHGRRALGDRFDPVGVRLLAACADVRGLDAVATTNHDYYTRFDRDGAGPALLPGIEVSTTRGHVLVVGPDPPAETVPGESTPAETVAMAHDRGCAAVLAHPFRNSSAREVDAPYDAVEVNGKRTESHEWAVELAERRGVPVVGGSDAHFPFEVGRAYTLVDAEDPTPAAVVDAIRDGRVSARVRRRAPDRLLRRVYRAVHGRRGPLEPPEWVDPGGGGP